MKYFLKPHHDGNFSALQSIDDNGVNKFPVLRSYGSKEYALARIKELKDADERQKREYEFYKNNPPIYV